MSEAGGPPEGSDDPTQGGGTPPSQPWEQPGGGQQYGSGQYGQYGQYGHGQYGHGQYGHGQQGWYQPQQAYGWHVAPETNGKATAALVLGICGLVVCPLICSIIGLVLGYQARKEIDASGGRQSGRGNAVAGIVLGWIGVGLSIIGIIFIIIAVAVDDSYDDDYYDFERVWPAAVVAGRVLGNGLRVIA